MEKKHLTRLTALDGLRGFAILLVFFNHIPTWFILQVIPQSFFGWIFVNGVTGVTFLFILSGFLMYYIYPNPASGVAFLQKRYTRIFPLFLTMSAVMFTGRQLPNASWLLLLGILLSYPLVTNFLWTKCIKKLPTLLGTVLFFAFFGVQMIAGLFYVFWINKQSFAAFSALPILLREGIIYIVNATLTLPFGQYVPMLDGVYWSLASEILFYILYPILVIPLVKFLLPKPLKVKILFLISLFFLLGGIHMLSYKIFVLSLVQPALFFYFAAGIILAHLYTNKQFLFKRLSTVFSGKLYFLPLVIGFLTVMTVHDLSFLGQWISPWVRMLFAIPIAFCVAILLAEKTVLQKLFTTKLLLFLGMISYSIYLSHGLIVHIAESFYSPTNFVTNVLFILVTLTVESFVAWYLYHLLEAPYFIRDKHVLPTQRKYFPTLHGKVLVPIICTVYLIGVFAAYQSKDRFNFFSLVTPISYSNFLVPQLSTQSKNILLDRNHPVTLQIPASHNNLGLLSLQLHHAIVKNNPNPQAILFRLTKKGSNQPIVESTYSLDQFNNGEAFPFGFPPVQNATGNTYIAYFTASNITSTDYVTVNTTSVRAVYSADKKELLTHPVQFSQFIWYKIEAVFSNAEAQLTLLCVLPFVVFIFLALGIGKKRIFGYN